VRHPSAGAPYETAILEQLPRVLSRMDRDRYSPTSGCCDRTYWAWKFTDFPGARFQEAVCILSFVHATPFSGNPYHRNRNLLGWIHLALKYWTSLQHADGSFDEAYPNEHSLAATAFTTFYVGEALSFLGKDLGGETGSAVREAMRRAGHWLAENDETHGFLSNHLAAASAALQHVFVLTGEARFKERSAYFLDRVLDHQSAEGWYEEYGGADFGYQTHGTFYLARLLELEPQPRLAESLARAVHFQGLFIHPDRSLGGEYGSRNTQTYYPAAFEMLAASDKAAAWIAQTMRPAVVDACAAGIRAVDAYNLFPMLNNLAFALRACHHPGHAAAVPEEPGKSDDFLWFRGAGIARFRRDCYVAYIGASKGGVIKLFDRRTRRLAYSDCGYIGRQRNRKRIASQHFDPARHVELGPQNLSLATPFVNVSRPVMQPWLFLGFRVFSLTLGRFAALARWLKARLVELLIYRKQPVDVELRRTIEFHDSHVTVRDHLQGAGLANLEEIRWAPALTTIHMGSSRYFVTHELSDIGFDAEQSEQLDARQLSAHPVLERTIRFD
jgi:hypothetical protein